MPAQNRTRLAAALLLAPALIAAPKYLESQTGQSATTVVLSITSPNPMYYGQTVDGSAVVSSADGSTPGGTITFFDDTTSICVLAIAPSASCPASAGEGFATGTHVLTATYSGDATHAVSTSNAATITVEPDATTAQLNASPNPATAGQSITLTATIQGAHATPSGSVTLYDGSDATASAPLDATGTATFATSALRPGTHSFTAVYGATANFVAAASPTLAEQILSPAPAPGGSPYFTVAVDSITTEAGSRVAVPVTIAAMNGFSQPVNLACSNLPDEATCTFAPATLATGSGKATLLLSTAAPRDCGTTTPYSTASLPFAMPVAAGMLVFLVPRRRSALRGLLAALIFLGALTAITGCGTGNCTDLGTRPGTYTITVTGTTTGSPAIVVSQKVTVKVTI